MNVYKELEAHRVKVILDKLFPNGVDAPVALKILWIYSPSTLYLVNEDLASDAERIPDEVMDRLSFNLYEIDEEERKVVEDYCLYIVLNYYH